MSNEALKPSQLLPPYDGWYDFINQYPKKTVNKDKKRDTIRLEYETSRDVVNTISFSSKTPKTSHTSYYEPTLLMQKYISPHKEFRIEVSYNDQYLSNQLDLTLPDPYFGHIAIENESIFWSSQWKNNKRIFLLLDEQYLLQLKKLSLLPKNAKERIWIHNADQETNISIMVEGEEEKEERRPLTEKILRRICQEADFNFDFNPPMEQVTRGNIGSIHFSLDQPRLTALDAVKIWDSLTSHSPKEQFIFPVHVSRK